MAPENQSKPETPEWHYDEVMRWIEPDLMSHMLKTHAERYKNETREQTIARMEQYDRAFAIFDKVVAELAEEDRAFARKIAHIAQKQAHTAEEKERAEDIQKAEDQMR